jgi:WD40 repeat protein/Flp pilus assembly protein TadD
MAQTSKTFRVFISSTFSDLKAERNALQAYVFPRLRELCEQHGSRFQPIDLRWGVSEEASLDQQAMNICLGEVDRCQKISPRPNFIVLLGNRYGWMPPPAQIPKKEYQAIQTQVSQEEEALLKDWYKLDTNALDPEYRLQPRKKGKKYEKYADWQPVEAELQRILADAVARLPMDEKRKLVYQASATHQEIQAGALEQKDAPEHVFCFFRDIPGLPKTFSKPAYDEILTARLKLEPLGLKPACKGFIKAVRDLPAQTSATELHTFLKGEQTKVPERSDEEGVLQFVHSVLVDITGKDFINLDEEAWAVDEEATLGLKQLKVELRQKFSANLFKADYVDWRGGDLPSDGSPYQLIGEDHIGKLPEKLEDCLPLLADGYQPKNLCEALFYSLGRVILAEVEAPHPVPGEEKKVFHIQPHEALDVEGLEHHAFAEERLTYFVGREQILKDINAYLQSGERQVLAIFGEGGTGKSALIAKAVERAQKANIKAHLVYRFIGTTPGSSDGRSLLEGLCKEISRRYGADEGTVPLDFRDLVPELEKRMGLATAENTLVLFLDSLDQLSQSQDARRLSWLPAELPEHVSLVVSSRTELDIYQNLQGKSAIEKQLGGLEEADGLLLLDEWLKGAKRALTVNQQGEVLSKFKASKGNPLYLKLAFEEARLWTSYQDPQEELAIGVAGIIKDNMIKRLTDEGNHGKQLVSHALGYLAASRQGLAEDELVDLLSRDLDVYEWFFRQTYHLPSDLVHMAMAYLKQNPAVAENLHPESYHDAERLAIDWLKLDRNPPEPVRAFLREALQKPDGPRLPIVLWSRLSFDLGPYLTERMVDGSSLLSFYHRELGDVSKEVFLAGDNALPYHEKLAGYFRFKADPKGDQSWTGGNIHALSELPYHLTYSEQDQELVKLLNDFLFLEAKTLSLGPQPLLGDFDTALAPGNGLELKAVEKARDELTLIRGAIQLSAPILTEFPQQIGSQLTGRLLSKRTDMIEHLFAQVQQADHPWLQPFTQGLIQSGGAIVRYIPGTGQIEKVAISENGRWVVTCNVDFQIETWDLRTGKSLGMVELERLDRDDEIAVSNDGFYLLVFLANEDTLQIWDLTNGIQKIPLVAQIKGVGYAVNPDNRKIAPELPPRKITSKGNWVQIYAGNPKSHQITITFGDTSKHAHTETSDGRWALVPLNDSSLAVLDQNIASELPDNSGTGTIVNALAVSTDGRLAASESELKNSVMLWNMDTGERMHDLTGHEGNIEGLAFTPDGDKLVAVGNWITVWDLGRKERLFFRPKRGAMIDSVVIAPNGKQVLTASRATQVFAWDLDTGDEQQPIWDAGGLVSAITVSGNGRLVYIAPVKDKSIRVWDLENGTELHEIDDSTAVKVIKVTPDGSRMACSGTTGVQVWDLERGENIFSFTGELFHISGIDITPDGDRLVSASEASDDWMVRVWDLDTGKELANFSTDGPLSCCAISADGTRIIAGEGTGMVHILHFIGAPPRFPPPGKSPDYRESDFAKIEALREKGIQYHREGNYLEAIRCFDRILDIDPRDTHTRVWKINIYLAMERYQEAVNQIENCLDLKPDSGSQVCHLYNLKGMALSQMGDLNGAIAAYNLAVEADPTESNNWYNLGLIYFKLQDFTTALPHFLEARRLEDLEQTLIQIAQCYFMLDEYGLAAKTYLDLVDKGSKEPRIYYSLGIAQSFLGEDENARKNLAHFIRIAGPEFAKLVENAKGFLKGS